MSKVWLLRGCAAAVFAVIVAAWAVGIAGGRDEPAPANKADVPAEPVSSTAADPEPSDTEGPSTDEPTPSESPVDGPTTGAADQPVVPVDAAPRTPDSTPRASTPTKRAGKPSRKPSNKPSTTPSGTPSGSPSGTPSNPPARDCTDVRELIDCVLAPITTRP